MLLLRTAAKKRIKALLLLLLPSLAMQQKARGNHISEFLVWFHLDFLGIVTTRLFYMCSSRRNERSKIALGFTSGEIKNRSRLRKCGEKFANSRFIAPRLFSARGFPCYFHPKMLFPARNRLIAKSFHLQNTRSRSSS